jgi:carbonic anhydrase
MDHLFNANKQWAAEIKAVDPQFFAKLSAQQSPEYLWIGCADSRVPATQLVDLLPGDMFVHRNIANIVIHTDLNCQSVLQYAVEVLRVKHIIVCGHYGCGGIRAALSDTQHGLIDNWLRVIKDIYSHHRSELAAIANEDERVDRLCELNVRIQVANVCHTTIVQKAWAQQHPLSVHGWIYSVADGLLKSLENTVSGPDHLTDVYRMDI